MLPTILSFYATNTFLRKVFNKLFLTVDDKTNASHRNNCLKKSRGRSRDISGRRPSSSWATPAHGIIRKGLVDEFAPHLRHWVLRTSNGLRHHHTPSAEASYWALSEVEASLRIPQPLSDHVDISLSHGVTGALLLGFGW